MTPEEIEKLYQCKHGVFLNDCQICEAVYQMERALHPLCDIHWKGTDYVAIPKYRDPVREVPVWLELTTRIHTT